MYLDGLAQELLPRRHDTSRARPVGALRGDAMPPVLLGDQGDDDAPRLDTSLRPNDQPATDQAAREQDRTIELDVPGRASGAALPRHAGGPRLRLRHAQSVPARSPPRLPSGRGPEGRGADARHDPAGAEGAAARPSPQRAPAPDPG